MYRFRKKGKHNITMKYIPNGFIIGLIISSLSFIITIVYTRKK
ncbi:MAG: YfhO family protein [Clostridium sp.]|nr:MAG: YfhO family protein [Clostridium sp.]